MSILSEIITKTDKYGKADVSEHLESKPRDWSLISKDKLNTQHKLNKIYQGPPCIIMKKKQIKVP